MDVEIVVSVYIYIYKNLHRIHTTQYMVHAGQDSKHNNVHCVEALQATSAAKVGTCTA